MSQYLEKIKRVEHLLCQNCKHEQCGTSICPIEILTDDEILEIYRNEFGDD